MTAMYGVQVLIQPTAGMTFRRLPGSILHIASYPSLPPTTMSGFLRRLAIGETGDLPENNETPEQRATTPNYYVLPRSLIALGAYPLPDEWFIHTTKRQGIRAFNHDAFSRIFRKANKKEVYQLHDWDYLICGPMTGFVLSEDSTLLKSLKTLINRGCKLGKEGYAYVSGMNEVQEFHLEKIIARPNTITPGNLLAGIPCNVFPMYRYEWDDKDSFEMTRPIPSPIKGFVPYIGGIPAEPIETDFYTDGKVFIPKSLVDLLK
jgi:hypothetical protein